jgi:hypothetical protein
MASGINVIDVDFALIVQWVRRYVSPAALKGGHMHPTGTVRSGQCQFMYRYFHK